MVATLKDGNKLFDTAIYLTIGALSDTDDGECNSLLTRPSTFMSRGGRGSGECIRALGCTEEDPRPLSVQNYANHARFVPGYHFVLFGVLVLTIIGSVVNFVVSLNDHQRLYSASLIMVLSVCVLVTSFYARVFALKAQDRAIHAEENLRHFAMTGKLLDPRLAVLQIVALRFASDAEFVALAARAASENLDPKSIKQAVKIWRADEYRV